MMWKHVFLRYGSPFSYLPALRGLLSISRVDPAKAIDALQNSTPYELGQPPSNFFGLFGVMYPVL
jgi:hypothetical protein